MAGHMMELAKPRAAIASMDAYPSVSVARIVKITPMTEKYFNAFAWERYFGMKIMPTKYPTIIPPRVNEAKNLASENS